MKNIKPFLNITIPMLLLHTSSAYAHTKAMTHVHSDSGMVYFFSGLDYRIGLLILEVERSCVYCSSVSSSNGERSVSPGSVTR